MSATRAIVNAAFDRSKVAMLALFVLALLGVGTYQNAPREADPDIPLPFIWVTIPLPGISPEDAERLLLRPTEVELQNIEGLVEMNAFAFEGMGQIRMEFEAAADMAGALLDVRDAVDTAKADYPTSALEPVILEMNAQQLLPVVTVVLSGDAPERAIFAAANRLQDQLRTVPGVFDVTLVGEREEQVNIVIAPETMENYGLTPAELANALQRNNALVTAGTLFFDDGRYGVKVPGLVKSLEDIANVPIRADANNVVTLGDIATIRRTFEDPAGYVRFNGKPAIGLNVTKRSGVNLLTVTESVKTETLATVNALPQTIEVGFIGDQSVLVQSIFTNLTASILLAILLVMIVIVAALGLRSAALVGIAIPASFLIGLALIGMMGFTLNMLVMFSMVLSVGMLVDGAIVIVELADRRMSEGASRKEAFREASIRMFWPIVASTATTLAAFVPFLFWNAIEGYFMRWIPITLILVLSGSLLVALIFLPIIGSAFAIPRVLKRKFGLKGQAEGRDKLDLDNIDPTTLPGFTGLYARTIRALVNRPVVTLTISLLTLMTCMRVFATSGTEVENFLRADSEQVQIYINGRGNISPSEVLEVSNNVAHQVGELPEVEYAYLETGPQIAMSQDAPPEALALLTLDLVAYQDRQHSLKVLDKLRAMTADTPGVIVEVRQPEQGPPIGKDVQVELSSLDFADAERAGIMVRAFMETSVTEINGREVPTFVDVEDSRPLPGVEWQLVPDREEAGRYGLTVADVGAALQLATEGLIVDTYRPDDSDEELDIKLRYPADARTIGQLTRINIATPNGNVPLSNFVVRTAKQKVDRITRRDGHRVMDVAGNANDTIPGFQVSQDKATIAMQGWLESGVLQEEFGSGIRYRLRGAAEAQADSTAFFQGAGLAAMFMIGVILLLQFNSFYHAALTLSAVIFSVIGVLFGIAISGQYISQIMTGVGIVALAGIVVNNNIVLIDTYHGLRANGLGVRDATIRTAAQRLRPVLLTTLTTIIGLLPMVFEINIDFAAATIGIGNATSDWWVLLSSAIVYGLAFSTFLTLLLTPVLLAAPTVLGDRMAVASVWVRYKLGDLFARRRASPAGPGSAQANDDPANQAVPPYRTAAE